MTFLIRICVIGLLPLAGLFPLSIVYRVELHADALIVSQTVTQKDVHIKNLTELVEMLEAEGCADVVEVFCIKAVAVHARVNREMRLAGRTGFAKELVKSHRGAKIRYRSRQLEFDKVGEVCWSARAGCRRTRR